MKLTSGATRRVARSPEEGGFVDGVIRSAETWVHHSTLTKFDRLKHAATFQTFEGEVRCWRDVGDWTVVPRNLPGIVAPTRVVDTRPVHDMWDFGCRTEPRNDTQRAALNQLGAGQDGLLELACGKGKTVVSLMHAARVGKPFLVVLDNGGLGWQWLERCLQFYDASADDIGMVWGWDPLDTEFMPASDDALVKQAEELSVELAAIGNEFWPWTQTPPSLRSRKFADEVLRSGKAGAAEALVRGRHIEGSLQRIGRVLTRSRGRAAWSRPIVIAGTRTIAKHAHELPAWIRQRFAGVYFDEAHHLPADMLSRVLPLFHGQRVALTATPDRSDGRTPLIHAHCGATLLTDLTPDLPAELLVLYTDVWPDKALLRHRPRWASSNPMLYATKIEAWLADNEARNSKVARLAARLHRDGRRKVLVLTVVERHVHTLSDEINSICGAGTCVAVSGTSVPDYSARAPLMEAHAVVVATIGVALEGLDIAEVDTLVYATLPRNARELFQSKGRTERALPGKAVPLAYFLLDQHVLLSVERMARIDNILREQGAKAPRGARMSEYE